MSPLAIIGANGMLAQKVCACAPESFDIHRYDLPDFDMTNREQVIAEMRRLGPSVIINCAAFTNVDGCEEQEALATRVNGEGVANLIAAAKDVGAVLVHISTDYVYSGRAHTPYSEDDPLEPLSAYGRSKLVGERAILQSGYDAYFILRTSWLYGPGGKNFVETMLRLAAEREEMRVVVDQIGTPTYTGDLATAIFALLHTPVPQYGVYNFSNLGECSWHQFAEEIVHLARQENRMLKVQRVLPIRTEEYPLPAVRPSYSVLSKEKFVKVSGMDVPNWKESLKTYMQERC